MEQSSLSSSQFGCAAEKYLESPVHARGKDLERLSDIVSTSKYRKVLDLGCGAGHAAYSVAKWCETTACDISDGMLEIVSRESKKRDLDIETVRAQAESLPFEDESFCLTVTRYSAHHWFDIGKALSEAFRVTKRGGRMIVIDSVSPEFPLYDTVIQTIELLRDASHVRNYRVSEWKRMLENAGFGKIESDCWKVRIDFESWIGRLGTSHGRVSALKEAFMGLPKEAKAYFNIGDDLSFDLDVAWISAEKERNEGT
jgi:ubiquinone/menaquinone biosynthesis C-methylase UbiE